MLSDVNLLLQSDGTRGLVLEKVRTKCTVSASKPAVTNAPINLSNKDTVIAKVYLYMVSPSNIAEALLASSSSLPFVCVSGFHSLLALPCFSFPIHIK